MAPSSFTTSDKDPKVNPSKVSINSDISDEDMLLDGTPFSNVM
jgi:hypothetical protein